MIDEESLHRQAGWQLAKAVQQGTVSASKISDVFIQRTRLLNSLYRAWVYLDEPYWRRQAEVVDQGRAKGLLTGVPVGVKDIMNTEVYPTEMGSAVWKGHKAGNDARCVSYVRREGGIIAGKTDTAEFAVHTPNRVRNPWDIAHVSGTSSGGSAVAVATAMVPMALGTQTAGSTIRPGSWCGVYGMKPSFGLIPRTGVLKTTDTLDNIGFYGRDALDLQLLLDVLRVRGDNYPGREEALARKGATPSRWRVAFVRGHLWDEAPEYVHSAMDGFAKQLDSIDNVDVTELDLPDGTRHTHELHRRIYNPCLAYYFRDEVQKTPGMISDCFMRLVEDGRTIPPENYKSALEEQEQLAHAMEDFFDQRVDLLIHHSSNGSAPIGSEPAINKDLNPLWTLTWLPVVTVPQFRCPAGLPFGFQVIGPRYSDYRVLSFVQMLAREGIAPSIAEIAELERVI
jgi:Asp-tRNA(Asn)/Glu-tRNA(Gln) amidotransferase A subunit family amidase